MVVVELVVVDESCGGSGGCGDDGSGVGSD